MLTDRALLKREQASTKIAAEGLDLSKPQNMKEPYAKGKLMSISENSPEYPHSPRLEVGMMVNYWHQNAILVVIDDVEYDMISKLDIWAIR